MVTHDDYNYDLFLYPSPTFISDAAVDKAQLCNIRDFATDSLDDHVCHLVTQIDTEVSEWWAPAHNVYEAFFC